MGESMGGAVLMCLATRPPACAAGARYVLVAPAVWGRATHERVPAQRPVAGRHAGCRRWRSPAPPVRVTASDNRDALIRLSRDPLTIHATRVRHAARAGGPDGRRAGRRRRVHRARPVPVRRRATNWCRRAPWPAMWRTRCRPGGARMAYYPGDYHLMLRDLGRAVPIGDVDRLGARPAGTAALRRRPGRGRVAGPPEPDRRFPCVGFRAMQAALDP